MKMTAKELNRLLYLCGAIRDEVITLEEFEELEQILENSPQSQNVYLDYVYLCTDLCKLQAAVGHLPDSESVAELSADLDPDAELTTSDRMQQALMDLGDYEKRAETLELPKEKKPTEPVYPKMNITIGPRKFPTYSVVTFAASLAALLLMVLYVRVFPSKSPEVATVLDSINAQYASSDSFEQGTRLTVSTDFIQLQKGIVKIEFDKGARMIIEAPADFRFLDQDRIRLNLGKLTAYVPKSASGFTVKTANSEVIDLGTRFGVYVDAAGRTELHVFEGKTLLIAGQKNQEKNTAEVYSGQAFVVNVDDNEPADIVLKRRLFVQEIDSSAGLIWNGETQINMADVLGGGSGFGNGKMETGIDPETGDYGPTRYQTRRSANTFVSVDSNIFIDGVFVPNGSSEQQITSAGHIFKECPVTSGYFYSDLIHTPATVGAVNMAENFPLSLDDMDYSSKSNPCIFLHTNLGITFDLDAFRARLPEATIDQFSSEIGIADLTPAVSTADFWILIDGQVKYHQHFAGPGLADTLTIDIRDEDRFLTLVTTDGGDSDQQTNRNNAIGYDWCLFGKPVLNLK